MIVAVSPVVVDDVIHTDKLTKFYGRIRGIESLDLAVRPGEIFGFIGPNGAGKSTTIRLLLDLIRPNSGTASVFGLDIAAHSREIRRRVGYLPGELTLFDAMTGRQLLGFVSALRGTSVPADVATIVDTLDLDLDRKVKNYSSGNRQKLALTQALMHRPELLILDEPTNALDPLMQQAFHGLLQDARNEGRTVFLSSHVLPEVERVADRVGIIRNGFLVAVESIAALKQRAVHRLEVRFAESIGDRDPFGEIPAVRSSEISAGGHVAHLLIEGSIDAVVKQLAGYSVESLVSHDADLEEAFLAYYAAEPTDAS